MLVGRASPYQIRLALQLRPQQTAVRPMTLEGLKMQNQIRRKQRSESKLWKKIILCP
jgi:hypothetical protein